MEPKKQRQIEKRDGVKPFHHIDACILTEVLLDQPRSRESARYINKLERYFRSAISTLAVGEIATALIKKEKIKPAREECFKMLENFVLQNKVDIFVPVSEVLSLAQAIQNSDSRIDASDATNLACAIVDGADAYVTFDRKLLNNETLERMFKIRIKEPSMLV